MVPTRRSRSAARQARVGIESDDVADAGNCFRRRAGDGQKCGIGRAAKEPIQFVELSAFALPAHPFAFAFVPEAPAMEQEKAVAASGRGTVSEFRLAMPW